MGTYRTLELFPFPVPHGSADSTLAVPLATIVRWYRRVRRWEMTFTMGATSVTGFFEQALNSTGPISSEEELQLLRCELAETSESRDGVPSTGALGLAIFKPGSRPDTIYDPGAAAYLWDGASAVVSRDTDHGTELVTLDPAITGGTSVAVPLTIDGFSRSVAGKYFYTAADASPPPDAPSFSCAITPVEFWSWGGKYDTTTGARL